MAQTGFTPIQLYTSTTAAAAPTSGNLAQGELAINITDEKLYFKNAAGTVKLLASAAGSAGDVVGPASATADGLVAFNGTTGKLVKLAVTVTVAQGGTGVTSSTGTGSNVLNTSPTLVTPALGTPSSGVVTNLTGTASININGTVGATTAAAGSFTTVTATSSGTNTISGTNIAYTVKSSGVNAATTIHFTDGIGYNNYISGGAGSITIQPSAAGTIALDIRSTKSQINSTLSSVSVGANVVLGLKSGASGADNTIHFTDALTYNAYISATAGKLSLQPVTAGVAVATVSSTGLAVTGAISATTTIATGGYTVATLPAGTVGQRAYVTDATTPAYNTALTGGGAVRVPVFRNATVWVSA